MKTYNFWVCKQTFIFKEGPKGDTKYGRGTVLLLPEGEEPPGSEKRFKKLVNTYVETDDAEEL